MIASLILSNGRSFFLHLESLPSASHHKSLIIASHSLLLVLEPLHVTRGRDIVLALAASTRGRCPSSLLLFPQRLIARVPHQIVVMRLGKNGRQAARSRLMVGIVLTLLLSVPVE